MTNVVSVLVQELNLTCIKCFGCFSAFWMMQINCCAELHVTKENCLKSFEKVNLKCVH